MRRATQSKGFFRSFIDISIHALHEESDLPWQRLVADVAGISIHALHEESDVASSRARSHSTLFQSTLSMRRATNPTPYYAG